MKSLLTFAEIQHALDREFAPLEPMIDGFRLVPSRLASAQVHDFEQRFQESLPAAFQEAVLSYDFGKLTIGPVAFCNSGDYLHDLEARNQPGVEAWWGAGDRPEGQLIVANSDPYAIVLDARDGTLSAFRHEEHWTARLKIARDFEVFVRGTGTAFIERQSCASKEQLANEILVQCGADHRTSFWKDLVS